MLRTVVCVVAAGLAVVACGGHDKAGGARGAGGETIPIAVAENTDRHLSSYAAAVERLARVPTRVTVREGWRENEPDADAAIVRDVRRARLPFALVSARVFDTLGVRAFAPLLAPLAIDSLEAERRVLAAGIADRALPALERLGVVGVAVLPGDLKHPLGLRRPLLRPEDFQGASIGVRRSAIAKRAFEQLGAQVDFMAGGDYAAYDGIEADLRDIEAEGSDVGATSLTVDVSLWPRLLVLVANPKAWRALHQRRQQALRAAARASLAAAIERLRLDDAESYGVLCRRGAVSFARATPRDVAALRAALTPVSDDLEAPVLREIARAREQAGPPPAQPPCRPGAVARPGPATPVDGAWDFESDEADLVAAPGNEGDVTPENWGHYVFAFSRGRFAITQEAPGACTWVYGTFSVRGHRMIWDVADSGGFGPHDAFNRPGEHFEYSWSRFKDTLELSPVRGAISPNNFLALAWRRVGDDARRAPLSRRCPPPPAGLQL
jgi:TRAP-type C4-dicarboxylate transport system substrate-binding protein